MGGGSGRRQLVPASACACVCVGLARLCVCLSVCSAGSSSRWRPFQVHCSACALCVLSVWLARVLALCVRRVPRGWCVVRAWRRGAGWGNEGVVRLQQVASFSGLGSVASWLCDARRPCLQAVKNTA